METIKIWDSNESDKFIFPTNIEELRKAIKGSVLNFKLKEKYDPDEEPQSRLDEIANKNKKEIIYTDEEHPFAISINEFMSNSYINPTYYQKHKKEIINVYQEELMTKDYIYIYPAFYDDEFVQKLLDAGKTNIFFKKCKP